MRHALLGLEKLSVHPETKQPQNKPAYAKLKLDIKKNLGQLEILRPKIEERYEQYQKDVARRKAEREQWIKEHPQNRSSASIAREQDHMSERPSSSGSRRQRKEIRTGHGENHDHLARSLAHKEFKKRRSHQNSSQEEVDDLARLVIQAGKRSDDTFVERNGTSSQDGKTFTPRNYNYPTVPGKKDYDWRDQPPRPTPPNDIWRDTSAPLRSSAPQLPPKEHLATSHPPLPPKERAPADFAYPLAPPRPDKILTPDISDPPSRSSTLTPDPNTQDYTFVPSAFTESGAPLRTVFMNPHIRGDFLRIAQPNTAKNLETCGILCGTLISNAFFISKLVIPEQEATSDTCDTVNESALFDYVDDHNLMTLGWIHTHPSQTCFMSSRDLHTHGGYQVQLAESIAIVCAPSKSPDVGVFRLTDPPGLKTILGCRKTGLFHPHEVDNIYCDATRPGHVAELEGLEFELVDLRPKRRGDGEA
jgi:STAM-binding protein